MNEALSFGQGVIREVWTMAPWPVALAITLAAAVLIVAWRVGYIKLPKIRITPAPVVDENGIQPSGTLLPSDPDAPHEGG